MKRTKSAGPKILRYSKVKGTPHRKYHSFAALRKQLINRSNNEGWADTILHLLKTKGALETRKFKYKVK